VSVKYKKIVLHLFTLPASTISYTVLNPAKDRLKQKTN